MVSGGMESMDDLQCWSDACYPGLSSKGANAPSLDVSMCVASGAGTTWNPRRSDDGWPTKKHLFKLLLAFNSLLN